MIRPLLIACALVIALGGSADAQFLVIRNAKNPTTALARDKVKGVFSGKTRSWPSGTGIVLVIGSEESPAMKWLAETVFGVSPKTLLAKIKQDVFKGDVTHPLSADDDAKTIQRVASGAGVVGIVSEAAAKQLPATVAILAVQ